MNPIAFEPNLAYDFLSFLRARVDSDPGDMNVMGLQGIAPTGQEPFAIALNPNKPNIYNDTLAVVFKHADGTPAVRTFLGTVDPGDTFKDQPGGRAHLTFGQHLYVRGSHMGHPALRALNETNRIWRDVSETGVPGPGNTVAIGAFGVNIHAGGSTPFINNWSAGCLNICGGWDGEPWKSFIALVESHFARKGSVGVTVWSAKDLCRFADDGWSMKPTLCFGMFNPWVGELQNALRAKGYFHGTTDSDWQGETDAAVRAFQGAQNLEVDGRVGRETWLKLLA